MTKSLKHKAPDNSPSHFNYTTLVRAYSYFNYALFEEQLPDCLITMQRRKGAYGYFAGGRFQQVQGDKLITDEIALNPSHFKDRPLAEVLSTLVHEMVHLWQHHKGTPSRTGYHNKEWAQQMQFIGLMPSTTGAVGGKTTGQKMTHYIIKGGFFDRMCDVLIKDGFMLPYHEVWNEDKTKKSKAASKTKYTCDSCEANAWAKPGASLICGDCQAIMLPADSD